MKIKIKKENKSPFIRCKKNPRHIYSKHSAKCPWCEHLSRGLPDYFPDVSSSYQNVPSISPNVRIKTSSHYKLPNISIKKILTIITISVCLLGIMSIMSSGHNESTKPQDTKIITATQTLQPENNRVIDSIPWGTRGSDEGELSYPGGVCIDNSGNLFVADTNNHRISAFSSNGEYMSGWISKGDTLRNVKEPDDIAIDSSNFLYVVDRSKIKKFDKNGRYILEWGGSGNRNGLFVHIMGITIDKSNTVYVLDSYEESGDLVYRIQSFSSDGDFKWSRKIQGANWLSEPEGFTVDDLMFFYVSDGKSNRIVKIDTNGGVVTNWGNNGVSSGVIGKTGGIAVDSRSRVFVTDLQENKFAILSNSGKLEQIIKGEQSGSVSERKRILLTQDGNVLILDRSNQPFTWFLSSDLQSSAPIFTSKTSSPYNPSQSNHDTGISIYDIFSEYPTFSGYADKPMTFQKWPMTLRITEFSRQNGHVKGILEWPTLDGSTEIEGHITGDDFSFTETGFIERGNILLDCTYQVEKEGSTWSGTWNPPAKDRSGGGGTITFHQIS